MSTVDEAKQALLALENRKNKQVMTYDGSTKFEAIVFEGGGSKGVAYGGALKRLQETGILSSIKKFGGTSAGAQTAAFLAAGCTPDDISSHNKNLDWSLVFDKSTKCCAGLANFRRLVNTFAECQGKHLLGVIEDRIAAKTGKSNITFQELYDKRGVDLHLGTSDLLTNSFVMLTKETHGDMPISLGAMASSSLPMIFPPIRWKKSLFVDGGMMGNLPLKSFQGSRLLALHLHPDEMDAEQITEVKDFSGFHSALLDTMFWGAQADQGFGKGDNTRDHVAELHKTRGIDIVNIDCGDCATVETSMSAERFAMIETLGYESINDWLVKK